MLPTRLLLASLLLLPALAWALRGPRGSWSRANTLCHTVATTSKALPRLRGFLWLRPDGGAPMLVQSAWDARGHLLGCSARVQPSLTHSYWQLCQALPSGLFQPAQWGPELRRALAALEVQKGSCQGLEEDAQAGGGQVAPRTKRVRRGWTMPGTLWCGAGDSAGNFSDLGVFQGPDVCCREHDQCEEQIPGLGYAYGMRNFRLHTISHCDCDKRFRACLMKQNDTISNFVGVTYFTYLEVPCFTLEESEECLEWHWWGGCKKYGPVPLARLVEQNQYHDIPVFGEKGSPVTPPPHRGKGKGKGKGKKHSQRPQKPLGQGTAVAPRRRSKVQASTAPAVPVSELTRISPSEAPASQRAGPVIQGTVPLPPTLGAASAPDFLKVSVAPATKSPGLPDVAVRRGKTVLGTGGHGHTTTPSGLASSQTCSCYRRLDQCPYRILPYEVKYQLHNRDSRTLFHCNCTRRLARFLRRTQGPNEVEGEVLSDYVSSACFALQTPPGCREGEEEEPNCIGVGKAVLAPARHLTNRLNRRHRGPPLKVKRQERPPPGKPLLLFEKCQQLVQDSQHSGPH